MFPLRKLPVLSFSAVKVSAIHRYSPRRTRERRGGAEKALSYEGRLLLFQYLQCLLLYFLQ